MRTGQQSPENDGFTALDSSAIEVLSAREERELLQELGACKAKLAQALASIKGIEIPAGADDPQTPGPLHRFLLRQRRAHAARGWVRSTGSIRNSRPSWPWPT